MVIAVYPGTFGPLTRGHEDLVRRAAGLFAKLVVGVADSRAKNPFFTFEERLQNNTVTPVPEQVVFRIDFRRWLRSLNDRDQRIIRDMMAGEGTGTLARRYGVSPARVSQLRREYHDGWERFGEDIQEEQPMAAA